MPFSSFVFQDYDYRSETGAFNFLGDQAAVHAQINAAGTAVVVEGSGQDLKAVVNRKSDDVAKEFASEIGEINGNGGVLAMLSFSYAAEEYIKAGDYISYEGLRAVIHKIKPRIYGGVLVRLRCLVEERAV